MINVYSQVLNNPSDVAVRGNELFVSGGSVATYRLPLTPSSTPTATLPFSNDDSNIAIAN